MKTHYEKLGVARNADQKAFKKALTKAYHKKLTAFADVINGKNKDPKRVAALRELIEVHDTLEDDNKRVAYDLSLKPRDGAKVSSGDTVSDVEAQWYEAFRRQAKDICHKAETVSSVGGLVLAGPLFGMVEFSPAAGMIGALLSLTIGAGVFYAFVQKKNHGQYLVEKTLHRKYQQFVAENPSRNQFEAYTRKAAQEIFAPLLMGRNFVERNLRFRRHTPG